MEIETEIKKWGNSLALRLSGAVAAIPGFEQGTKVILEISEDQVVIKRHTKSPRKLNLPFSEAALIQDMTHHTVHGDLLATNLTHKESGN